MENYLTCSWVIENISVHDKDYGTSILMFNVLNLEENGRGEIPRVFGNEGHREMNWSYWESKEGEVYIEVSGSDVDYFNTIFRVVVLDKKRYKVKFISDSVVLNCTGSYCKYGS